MLKLNLKNTLCACKFQSFEFVEPVANRGEPIQSVARSRNAADRWMHAKGAVPTLLSDDGCGCRLMAYWVLAACVWARVSTWGISSASHMDWMWDDVDRDPGPRMADTPLRSIWQTVSQQTILMQHINQTDQIDRIDQIRTNQSTKKPDDQFDRIDQLRFTTWIWHQLLFRWRISYDTYIKCHKTRLLAW